MSKERALPLCCTHYHDHIFVFGSNLAGIHGKGAALHAEKCHGAVRGVGEGPQGTSYAIPTKDRHIRTLDLYFIRYWVEKFLLYAYDHPELKFYLTKVGCGLAGHKEEDISVMFSMTTGNVVLPHGWEESEKEDALLLAESGKELDALEEEE